MLRLRPPLEAETFTLKGRLFDPPASLSFSGSFLLHIEEAKITADQADISLQFPWDGFHTSILERVQRKLLERGGG